MLVGKMVMIGPTKNEAESGSSKFCIGKPGSCHLKDMR